MTDDINPLVEPIRGDFDTLTGLLHRRAFDSKLIDALAHYTAGDEGIAVILADLDNFKAVNDRFGLWPGQEVLKSVGKLLQSLTQETIVIGRFGGDEFSVLSVGTNESQAQSLAELIETAVSRLNVNWEGQDLGPLSISTGVAFCPRDGTQLDDLIRAADSALLRAKERR